MKAAITSQGGQSASHEGWRGQGKKLGHGVTSSSRRTPREDYSVTRNGKKRLPTNTILSDSFSLLQLFYPWLPRPLLFVFPFVLPFFFSHLGVDPLENVQRLAFFFKLVFFFVPKSWLHSLFWVRMFGFTLLTTIHSLHCFASTRQRLAVVDKARHFTIFFLRLFFWCFGAEQGSLALVPALAGCSTHGRSLRRQGWRQCSQGSVTCVINISLLFPLRVGSMSLHDYLGCKHFLYIIFF